jgi:hypothetical protein
VKKQASTLIKEGISGIVTEVSGNQMPMKNAPRANSGSFGILTTVFIYEPTNISQVSRIANSTVYTAIHTKRVASVETDSTGRFTIALPPGTYSLFVKQGKDFFANLFDTNNNISLFTVENGKLTEAKLTVNSKATY